MQSAVHFGAGWCGHLVRPDRMWCLALVGYGIPHDTTLTGWMVVRKLLYVVWHVMEWFAVCWYGFFP